MSRTFAGLESTTVEGVANETQDEEDLLGDPSERLSEVCFRFSGCIDVDRHAGPAADTGG